jgi:hypothetical protein
MIFTVITAACCMMLGSCGESTGADERFTDNPSSWVTEPEGDDKPVEAETIKWDFSDPALEGWESANQGEGAEVNQTSVVDNADCEDGKALQMFTEADTQQRKKLRTSEQFGFGLYTWKAFIPAMGLNDRASIGSWLWHDDTHELDFEVGSGSAELRASMGLADDEVVAYITSQANPWVQQFARVKTDEWHTFQIELKPVGGKYFATWLVDGVKYAAQQLTFGEEYPFYIFCSVENLKFIGDHWPYQDTYGLWDYVTYTPYDSSMDPSIPADPTNPVDPAPEPDEGETVTWDFEDNQIPGGWNSNTNVGGDGPGYYSVADGKLNLSADDYCTRNQLQYATPVGFGKYTWNLQLPELAGAEKFLTGGTLYTSNEANGYHSVFMSACSGPEDQRTALGATEGQYLLRVYSEVPWVEKYVTVLEPGVDYKFTIELQNAGGSYRIVWSLDDEPVNTLATAFGPDAVKFNFIATAESNAGWMPGDPTTVKYTTTFDSIEYTAY